MVLTEVFWISLSTLFCGGVGLLIKIMYKIKCTEVKCCGCLEIIRNVEEEVKNDVEAHSNDNNRRSSLSLGFNKV